MLNDSECEELAERFYRDDDKLRELCPSTYDDIQEQLLDTP